MNQSASIWEVQGLDDTEVGAAVDIHHCCYSWLFQSNAVIPDYVGASCCCVLYNQYITSCDHTHHIILILLYLPDFPFLESLEHNKKRVLIN